MKHPSELLDLLRTLKDSEGGSIKRMRLLSEIWRSISALSPQERTRLLAEAGIEGGEEVLQRFLSNPGSEAGRFVSWAEAILGALDVKTLESSAVHAAKSRLSGTQAATVATVLSTVSEKLQEEKEELSRERGQTAQVTSIHDAPPPPPTPSSADQSESSEEEENFGTSTAAEAQVTAPSSSAPLESEAPLVAEKNARPKEPPLPDVWAGRPAPSPASPGSAGVAADTRPLPTTQGEEDHREKLENNRLELLLRRLEEIPSESMRFLELSREVGFLEATDIQSARALLNAVESPWMRRRVLDSILKCGLQASNDELISLCAEFCLPPGDFLFMAGNAIDLRDWTRAELESLASEAPAPYVKRMILRRARRL